MARPRLVFVDDRIELLRAVRRMNVRVVVLPPFDEHGVPTAPLIERLSCEKPGVGIVLVSLQPHGAGVALLSAVRSGASLLVAPTGDALWEEIASHLNRYAFRCVTESSLRAAREHSRRASRRS